ncbi:hypothetical protein GCM10027446_09940 [Angustibacter peucedani]
MTRSSWSPWAELRRRPDIWVHRCRLAEGTGWWCPDERVILLDDRLDRRAARCVLAHELAHAVLGHEACHDYGDSRWLAQRVEAEADTWAAVRLVAPAALAEALPAHPDDLEAVALVLDVGPDVVRHRLLGLEPGERRALAARAARSDRVA